MTELWSFWLEAIRAVLQLLSSDVGLGMGSSIIVTTLLLRTALLPISWTCAYRNRVRQKKLARLKPELERLKATYAKVPQVHMERVMALYRAHGLAAVDGGGLLGGLAQMPVLIGMYQVLKQIGEGVRFLWVKNLARPDVGFALLAGFATMLVMLLAPELPEHLRLWIVVVPGVLTLVAALKVGSALALYWVVSNCFAAIQTLALNLVLERRIRAGVLAI